MKVFLILVHKDRKLYLNENAQRELQKGVPLFADIAENKEGFRTFPRYSDACKALYSLKKKKTTGPKEFYCIVRVKIPEGVKNRLRYVRLPHKLGNHALYIYTPQIII